MASLLTVRLNKGDATNWGFRLQGGKDFGTPLVIQKVNGASPAERAGLIAGDAVIRINNTDVFNLRHKDAQDVVVRSGNSFDMTIQRGGTTWRPTVTPTGTLQSVSKPQTPAPQQIAPVTKTSLAANKKDNTGSIGTGHNVAAKPFANAQVNGNVNGNAPRIVNNQYNSPLKLYSEESIAETLSAQTEVLAPGVLGVNFKKNEKGYDAEKSAVFRMVQEADKEPKTPEPVKADFYATHSHAIGGGRSRTSSCSRSITPPNDLNLTNHRTTPDPSITKCTHCERIIVGVFVRIKDKNLHVECFKCATCGTSLKNVGYYNINNKLYCDIHAKLVAKNNPATTNLLTVSTDGKDPINAITSALTNHSLTSPVSPKLNTTAPGYQFNSLSPKPFGSVSAPQSTPTYKPLAPQSPAFNNTPSAAPTYSPISSTGKYNTPKPVGGLFKVWPPPQPEPEPPTACPLYVPPTSHLHVKHPKERVLDEDLDEEVMAYQQSYRAFSEKCYLNEQKSVMECRETLTETLGTQQLVEQALRQRPPAEPPNRPQTTESNLSAEEIERICSQECQVSASYTLKSPKSFYPKEKKFYQSKIDNSVPKQWESSMVTALKTIPEPPPLSDDLFGNIPVKRPTSALGSALAIAPSKPFEPNTSRNTEPVPLPEYTAPYFPPEHHIIVETEQTQSQKESCKFSKELQKVPKSVVSRNDKETEKILSELPKPQEKLDMLNALTTAPDRPYSPFSPTPAVIVEEHTEKQSESNDSSSTKKSEEKVVVTRTTKQLPPSFTQIFEPKDEKTAPGCYPLFKGFSCSFQNKTDHSQFRIEINTTPPVPNAENNTRTNTPFEPKVEIIETKTVKEESAEEKNKEKARSETQIKTTQIAKQAEDIVYKRPLPLAANLKKTHALPQYQKNISENAQADLLLMERIEKANQRHKQKTETKLEESIEINTSTRSSNQVKVDEEYRAQNTTFSPRPRPLTPSMINKPAATIPYYQASLVAQPHRPPVVNLLDPASPSISRSPSPCLGAQRPNSPFRRDSPLRPKSPAQGPPPNPLRSNTPLPTVRDFKMEDVRKSVSSYIPQHRSRLEQQRSTMTTPNDMSASLTLKGYQTSSGGFCALDTKYEESGDVKLEKDQKKHVTIAEDVSNKLLEQKASAQTQTQEQVGLQRNRVITEEYERHQKLKTIQIERGGASSTSQQQSTKNPLPFRNINTKAIEHQEVIGLHVTNPRPINSPFLKPTNPNNSGSVPQSNRTVNKSNHPDKPVTGAGGGRQAGAVGVAPKRGRGVLNAAQLGANRVPLCGQCHSQIRGPFITALGKIWCPDHFICATPSCRRPLQDLGFVEEQGNLHCEFCFEQYLAPPCSKCSIKIKGDCLKAIGKNFHPECFTCIYCGKLFGNAPFFLEDGNPYCEADWNELFTTKCFACGFPVEAGDRWVEALNNNYHSQCFNCTMCKKNLEGQSFFAKGGRPFCKNHAR